MAAPVGGAAANQDFVTYQGNSVSPIVTVTTGANGTPVDISTCQEITWTCRRQEDDATALITKTKSGGGIVLVGGGTTGQFQFILQPADTQNLSGFFLHQAVLKDGNGNFTTVTIGRMQIGIRPTWSYDPNSVSTVPLYQVRRLIGDTLYNDQQLQDGEIEWAITTYGNIWQAAAECCRNIAAQFSRQVDTVQGEMKTNYSNRAKAYLVMAYQLDQKGLTLGGSVTGFAGGISITDKTNRVADPDRVPPQFSIGMFDDLLPVAPAGLQTPSPAPPQTGAS